MSQGIAGELFLCAAVDAPRRAEPVLFYKIVAVDIAILFQ